MSFCISYNSEVTYVFVYAVIQTFKEQKKLSLDT